MAEVIWTDRAYQQLREIADHVALDQPDAAARLLKRTVEQVRLLCDLARLGRPATELNRPGVRQIWITPCWLYYRYNALRRAVLVLHVRRAEQPLRPGDFESP